MKIGILTFHASHNFGSNLQNYALQQFLISEGHNVETINLRNDKQKYMYHHPLHKGRRTPVLWKVLARFLDPKWLIIECKRWNKFENFLKNHLILSKEYKDWETIKSDLPINNYDTLVVGGDQIWNTFCYDFDWSYYLPSTIKPIKKIAYCPSYGNSIPKIQDDSSLATKIKEYLEDFDFLSVRETDASNFLHGLLNRDISVVADPTLLVNPSVFLNLIKSPIIKEPYIYYYTPSHTPDFETEEIAVELANMLGLKIVTSYPRFFKKNPMTSVSSGPIEFLNLVKNAQLVVGKSYHLAIFSIIFHKDFITLRCKNEERMESLFKKLNISGRNMESIDDYQNLTDLDYNEIDKNLLQFKNDSIRFLKDSLSSTY